MNVYYHQTQTGQIIINQRSGWTGYLLGGFFLFCAGYWLQLIIQVIYEYTMAMVQGGVDTVGDFFRGLLGMAIILLFAFGFGAAGCFLSSVGSPLFHNAVGDKLNHSDLCYFEGFELLDEAWRAGVPRYLVCQTRS